jgi:glycosyltransferase involved in cell wall biosynthesis
VSRLKITAVIPAFNEQETLSKVIEGVKEYADEVILVDDGSCDDTAEIARSCGAVVVSHDRNEGYDKSLDDGFAMAAERGADVVFTFDADGEHDPAQIELIIGPILEGQADVVVGRRPVRRRVSEHLFSFVGKLKAGVKDPLCGLKAYNIDVYKDVGHFDRVGSIGTELLFRAKKKGYRILQTDINLSSRADESRFGMGLKANWKIFKAILKIMVST